MNDSKNKSILLVFKLYLLIYFIRPSEWISWLNFPLQLYLGIISLIIIIKELFSHFENFSKDIVGKYIFFFFLLSIFSKLATGWAGGTWQFFLEFLPSIIAYYLVMICCKDKERIESLLFFLCIVSSVLSLNSILQALIGHGFGDLTPIYRNKDVIQTRWYGVFNDPNDLGLALISVYPYVFFKILNKHFLFIFFLLINAVGIYFTNSRGTLLSLIFGLGFFIFLKNKNLKGLILVLILLIGIVFFGPSRLNELHVVDESSYGRIDAWYAGFQMLIQNPFLGVGPNCFTEHHQITAHNSYILAAAETGIIGFFLYFGAVLSPILFGIKVELNSKNDKNFEFILAILSCALSCSFAIFFISRTYILIPYLISGILMSTIYACFQEKPINTLKYILSFRFNFLLSIIVLIFIYVVVKILI